MWEYQTWLLWFRVFQSKSYFGELDFSVTHRRISNNRPFYRFPVSSLSYGSAGVSKLLHGQEGNWIHFSKYLTSQRSLMSIRKYEVQVPNYTGNLGLNPQSQSTFDACESRIQSGRGFLIPQTIELFEIWNDNPTIFCWIVHHRNIKEEAGVFWSGIIWIMNDSI